MKKLKSIFSNTIRSLMTPLLTMLLSIIVINYYQVEFWGYFVERLLVIGIIIQIINWGNREFLLREFSKEPSKIPWNFSNNLFNRTFLLIPALIPVWYLSADINEFLYLIMWLTSAFIYQSFEVIVIYKKSFAKQIAVESLGFFITIYGIYSSLDGLNCFFPVLTGWYAYGMLAKMVVMVIIERKELVLKNLKFDLNTFKWGWPFLLIGLGGNLVTKADIYVLGIYGSFEDLGKYQVFINLIIYLQAIAAFVSTPFTRHMYRMPEISFTRISIRFTLIGSLITLLAIPIIQLIISKVYHLNFGMPIYIAAIFCVLPIYYYLPIILRIYRAEKEKIVMYINFLAALTSAVSTYVLYTYYGLYGVVLSVAVIQLCLASTYFVLGQKLKIQTQE